MHIPARGSPKEQSAAKAYEEDRSIPASAEVEKVHKRIEKSGASKKVKQHKIQKSWESHKEGRATKRVRLESCLSLEKKK